MDNHRMTRYEQQIQWFRRDIDEDFGCDLQDGVVCSTSHQKSYEMPWKRYLLDGIVELDDTYLGAPTQGKKRGRGTEKSKVIVAIAKTENNAATYLKMQIVPNLKSITCGKFANKNIV